MAAPLARRWSFELSRRMDENAAKFQLALESLQGELAKITAMATQLVHPLGNQLPPADANKPEQPEEFEVAHAAPAHVAQQVFDKMPAPKSCPSRCASPLYYYQEQEDSVLGTLVPDGESNSTEQNHDDLPQPYGFEHLNCRTVFLSDGTKHSYFALPEDYPLKQATPPISPSEAETVGFIALQFVTSAGSAPTLCCNNNVTVGCDRMFDNSLQLPLMVPDTSNDFIFRLEQQHNEKKPMTMHQLKAQPLNMLMIDKTRTAWDPGALKVPTLFPIAAGLRNDQNFENEQAVMSKQGREIWDPGEYIAADFPILILTAASVTKLQSTNVCKPAMLHILPVQLGTRRAPSFTKANKHSAPFCLEWTKLKEPTLLIPVVPYSAGTVCSLTPILLLSNTNYTWDPGVLNLKKDSAR